MPTKSTTLNYMIPVGGACKHTMEPEPKAPRAHKTESHTGMWTTDHGGHIINIPDWVCVCLHLVSISEARVCERVMHYICLYYTNWYIHCVRTYIQHMPKISVALGYIICPIPATDAHPIRAPSKLQIHSQQTHAQRATASAPGSSVSTKVDVCRVDRNVHIISSCSSV